MGQISEAKLALVRGLIERAPDGAVRSLLLALGADGGHDAGLAHVHRLLEAEASDRRARNMTFAPVAPLCGAGGPFNALVFPPRTLALIWRALRGEAPDEVIAAKALAADWRGDESSPQIFDALCARTADALRGGDRAFSAAAAAADAGSGREQLTACLDLAPVTRRALAQMPEWLGRITSEKAATLRLAYRDVVAVADDAGPRFFEMLCAHLAEPWLILRVICGVMDHPNEAYFAGSELAGFGARVLDDIDRQLAQVASFKADLGRGAARTAAAAAHRATVEIAEVEQSINLAPDGPWGRRLARQKRTLAGAIEASLKAVDDAVGRALPLQTRRMGPRAARGVPSLVRDPDPTLVEQAATLLAFMTEVRPSAAAGGFASARAKAQEALDARLDAYVEDILEDVRSADESHGGRAKAFLEIAAEFCGLARDAKAAQIVRRRAAA